MSWNSEATARFNLGSSLAAQGRFDQAASQFERAIALQPDFIDAYNALALSFLHRGQWDPALGVLRRAIDLGGTAQTKALFVQVLRGLRTIPDVADLRQQMIRALSEPWARPSVAAPIAAALVKHDEAIQAYIDRANDAWPRRIPARELLGRGGIAAISGHELLAALLPSTPVTDVVLERFLTALRFAMLDLASATTPVDDAKVVHLSCLLARQCFLNEYVFACDDDETGRMRALTDRLDGAIASGTAVPEPWIAAVACYVPLHSLPKVATVLDRACSLSLTAVLVQQVREPEQERQLRACMPTLTAIDDKMSLAVKEQYEQNPYPRWVKLAPPLKPSTFAEFLQRELPLARLRAPGIGGDDTHILVAGCGTAQEAIEAAREFPGARVLAIDLSAASLAYGARKARELGVERIEFAQADILALASLARCFDVILAGGVLHHLADPFAGWRVLLALLQPLGVMRVALYSERARAHVKAARAFIAERGYRPTPDDIRRCRQELLSTPIGSLQNKATRAEDFFTISECRDLIFHVQEHRHTLPEIGAFLADNELGFLGFDLPGATRQQYRARFPADRSMSDLDLWDALERENPDTFVGMYQFWVQKGAQPANDPARTSTPFDLAVNPTRD
jgi:SAM-dependent methyltransferase